MHLDSVKLNFNQWRTERKGREPIPDHLWKQVYKIDQQYPTAQICKTLSISGTQYKANRYKADVQSEFMEVSNPLVGKGTALDTFQFKLTSGEKTVTMEISEAQIPIVFAALKGVL